ncbi:VOC family protein [Natrononativus amylolyticus]|uniref:VOC family protein n=1 Tax=Natrononativus amylolyticus TaxID=2963434 RepID=UPI0020CCA8DE|nr:VOC family protein [Natrononativus amylolyticus]
MSGIVFFGTTALAETVAFYVDEVGAAVWLEQPDCTICRYDNLLFGFCERDRAETDGILTFVLESADAVDDAYDHLEAHAVEEPHENPRYEIYQFFAEDPEGRTVEFQTFRHETPAIE